MMIAKDRCAAPNDLDGHLVTRVAMAMAMGVGGLARLQQQIQQVLVGLRSAKKPKPKE